MLPGAKHLMLTLHQLDRTDVDVSCVCDVVDQ